MEGEYGNATLMSEHLSRNREERHERPEGA